MSVSEKDHGPIACRTLPGSFQDSKCLVCRQNVIWPRLERVALVFLLVMELNAGDFDELTPWITLCEATLHLRAIGLGACRC